MESMWRSAHLSLTSEAEERHMTRIEMVCVAAIAAIAGSGLTPVAAQSQQPGVTRIPLQQNDLGIPGREVVQVRVELAPGVSFPAHSHPGEEIVYVIEGVFEYAVEGRPPVTRKAGEVLFIPAGTVHRVTNIGSGIAAELATYIVEKGTPLVVTK
jgi:quercetin dioxygenase-like cupin family protein